MLCIRSILFPTDYSAGAEQAFAYASLFARSFSAEVTILFVKAADDCEPKDHDSWLPKGSLVNKLVVDHDDVAKGIVSFADSHEIDLIVMSSHARAGLDRLLHHPICESVTRSSPCPVLQIHADDPPVDSSIRRILVPVDFSDQSGLALAIAVELSRSFASGIDLLHVVPDDALPYVYGVEPVSSGASKLIQRAQSALLSLASQVDLDENQLRVHAIIGNPTKEIAAFAQQHCDGLTIVASHGFGGLRRFMLGSIAETVGRRSPCPVLSFRSTASRLLPPDFVLPKVTRIPSIP